MLVGVTVNRSGDPYYSPSFGRGGQTGLFAIEVMNLEGGGSTTLDVDVEHKNSDDTSWASAGSFAQFSSKGSDTLEVSGLKEMIRLKYTVGASAGDFVHIFVYAPTRQD